MVTIMANLFIKTVRKLHSGYGGRYPNGGKQNGRAGKTAEYNMSKEIARQKGSKR